MTLDKARRIPLDIAKLPDLLLTLEMRLSLESDRRA
jgi:hypothetical protein